MNVAYHCIKESGKTSAGTSQQANPLSVMVEFLLRNELSMYLMRSTRPKQIIQSTNV